MNLLVVNFHYICNHSEFKRGIYPTSPKQLRDQLLLLKEVFTFVSQQQILNAIRKQKTLPEKACLITFDDGLKCQYDLALPVLDEINVPGLFFVNTMPYDSEQPLLVHKVHWCQSQMSEQAFFDEVIKQFEHYVGKTFSWEDFVHLTEKVTKQYPFDNLKTGLVKYLLNRDILPCKLREQIIDAVFSHIVKDKKAFVDKFYLSKDQIKVLYRRNYLGFHGHSHRSMAILSEDELKDEFTKGIKTMKQMFHQPDFKLYTVSYPHGSKSDVSPLVYRLSKEAGFECGFTMNQAFNTNFNEPMALKRFDSNNVPGGKSPYFYIQKGRVVGL